MNIKIYALPIIPQETNILDLVVFRNDEVIPTTDKVIPNKNRPA